MAVASNFNLRMARRPQSANGIYFVLRMGTPRRDLLERY
jgi:hypothetical protein